MTAPASPPHAQERKSVVATKSVDLGGRGLSRASAYFGNGYVHAHDLIWLPLLAVVALAGTWMGRLLLRHMPQAIFRRIALALVFVIGWVTLYESAR